MLDVQWEVQLYSSASFVKLCEPGKSCELPGLLSPLLVNVWFGLFLPFFFLFLPFSYLLPSFLPSLSLFLSLNTGKISSNDIS